MQLEAGWKPWSVAVSLILAALGGEASASDNLYGVVFDTGASAEKLVVVDPGSGALTPVGGGIPGCCFISSGVSTLDPGPNVLYFVGFFMADPPGTARIFSLDTATGAVLGSPVLPAGNNYNFIQVDPSTGTLYGVVFDTGATVERLVEIDPATGGLTFLGAGVAGCCGIPSGVSALDPSAGAFYFIGGFFADPPGTFRIFALDLATGALLGNPVLPAATNYNFLEFDTASGTLYGVVFDTGTTTERLVEIDVATGALTPVGGGIPGCCGVPNGVSTLDPNGEVFYFIGLFMADPPGAFRVFGLDLASGTVLANPVLPAGFNYNFLDFDPTLGPRPPLEVEIDIKPGSFPNSVNPRSNGVIPVAVLTTPGFDALTLDVATVRFSGPGGAGEAHGHGHPSDVDGDGDTDLVLHFRTQATGILCGDTAATLVGATLGGDPIQGTDSIVTVGCH